MSIKVCGLHDVKGELQSADFVVSILDEGFDFPISHPHCIQVHMADTEAPTDSERGQMRKEVERILSWVKDNNVTLDHRLIVHCHMGISRSSAISWLILVQLGMDYKDAFRLLWGQHPHIWPNLLVLQKGSRILNLHPDFMEFAMAVSEEIGNRRQSYFGY